MLFASIPEPTLMTLLGAVFVASLLGSVHCAGMCGGLLLFAVADPDEPSARCGRSGDGQERVRRRKPLGPHAAYHLGRAASYVLLGVIAGTLGAAIDLGGNALGLQRAAAYLAGGTIILVGVALLARTLGVGPVGRLWSGIGFLKPVVERAYRLAMKLTPTRRAMAVGLLTPLLPCGWLYAFAITASSTSSPIAGGLTMLVFWAGTVPLMMTLGLGLGSIAGPLRRFSPTFTAAAIVAVGVFTTLGRGTLPESSAAALIDSRPQSTSDAIHGVNTVTPDICPLCDDESAATDDQRDEADSFPRPAE